MRSTSSASSFSLIVPPTRPVPRPRIVTGCSRFWLPVSSSFSLAKPALLPERVQLHGVQFRALRRELLLQVAGQRQVDVVAAQQDVLAHGHALQGQFARVFGDRDQA